MASASTRRPDTWSWKNSCTLSVTFPPSSCWSPKSRTRKSGRWWPTKGASTRPPPPNSSPTNSRLRFARTTLQDTRTPVCDTSYIIGSGWFNYCLKIFGFNFFSNRCFWEFFKNCILRNLALAFRLQFFCKKVGRFFFMIRRKQSVLVVGFGRKMS